MKLISTLLLTAAAAAVELPANTNVLWENVFPSDTLTVPDRNQITGRRVQLPLPDCQAQPSTCAELTAINGFDGFALLPRIRVPFSAPIDPATLKDGIKIVLLDNIVPNQRGRKAAGTVMDLNELVYDPVTQTAFGKPDGFLDQSRQFAVVVTNAVRDAGGKPVHAQQSFTTCLAQCNTSYCKELADVVRQGTRPGIRGRIVAASIFTTMAATAFMESAKNALNSSNPAVQARTFAVREISDITWRRQVRTSGPLEDTPLPLPVRQMQLLGVGRVAFGSFSSPRFLGNDLMMPSLPTKAAVPLPDASERLAFQVWLPLTPPPPGGYPVVLAGHGLTDNRFGLSSALIPGFMLGGHAILSMNAVGHGFGPASTVRVTLTSGMTVDLPGGGRGLDVNNDGAIEPMEGCVTQLPTAMPVLRDCLRQTALDLLQLSRAIRMGVDLDGNGAIDLNPNRVGYLGHSLGGYYGSEFAALDPNVKTFVFNSSGGSFANLLTNSEYRPFLLAALGARVPPLLNLPGDFDANLPLRNEPVRVNNVPGAIAIQEFLAGLEWLETPGVPYGYASYFSGTTLSGAPAKKVLFQYASGDQTVPNPTQTQLVRAADMRRSTQFLRYDVVRQRDPRLPANPHLFLLGITPGPDPQPVTPTQLLLSAAAQAQAVTYLATSGAVILDGELFGLPFETPRELPETLNFLQ